MSEEIVVRRPVNLTEATWERIASLGPTAADVARALVEGGLEVEPDPEEISRDMARRILEAPTPEAALDDQQPLGWQALLGQPVEVLEVRFQRSAFDGGAGAYAVAKACDPETGEVMLLTCGSRTVMAQLLKLAAEGALPAVVRLVRASKPTSSGYYPLRLVRA